MSEWQFFEIGFKTLNLFSFMLGMAWAFFNQGLFGKKIGLWVFLYFAGLAMFYGLNFYVQKEANAKLKQAIEQQETKKVEPVVVPPSSPKGGVYKPMKVE